MTQKADDKKGIILDTAIRVFGSRGYYETKVADIAEEASIAKGTMYLYFSSKEELFRAVMRREFNTYEERFNLIVDNRGLPFMEKMYQLSELHFTYYFERKNWGKLFSEHPNNDKEFLADLHEFILRYLHKVTIVMSESGIPQPGLAAQSFTGVLESFKRELMTNPNYTLEMLKVRVIYVTGLFVRQLP